MSQTPRAIFLLGESSGAGRIGLRISPTETLTASTTEDSRLVVVEVRVSNRSVSNTLQASRLSDSKFELFEANLISVCMVFSFARTSAAVEDFEMHVLLMLIFFV